MSVIEIRHRLTASVLFSLEAGSLRLPLEAAVKIDAHLRGADLQGADLRGAHLRGAHLQDADLRGADLRGANLRGAHLQDADLRGADLQGAHLRDAHLRGANLRGANLRDADLRGAHLRGADLQDADLRPIRDDLWAVLSGAPAEVPALRAALVAGQIDGSTYSGRCACLVGTLAQARGCGIHDLPDVQPDTSRLSERWFLNIHPGDTPKNSVVVAQTLVWVDTFLTNMRAAFGAATEDAP